MAEQEIIAAAEALLRERPFRELTVDEVMRRTDLSRPSFYVYFRDRHHLVLRVVEHIGGELFTMSDRWYPRRAATAARWRATATEGIVAVFAEHGPVLRALADAAADDPDVELVYDRLVQSFVDVDGAPHRRGDRGGPRARARRPSRPPRALVWMMERYLTLASGREPHTRRSVRRRDARDDLGARALRRRLSARRRGPASSPGRCAATPRGRPTPPPSRRRAGPRGRQVVAGAQRRDEVGGVGEDAGAEPGPRAARAARGMERPEPERDVARAHRDGEHLAAGPVRGCADPGPRDQAGSEDQSRAERDAAERCARAMVRASMESGI